MTIHRSSRYAEIADRVIETYVMPPTNEREVRWFKEYAPAWRNRVGIPRLTAEDVFVEASSLLRSVNPGIFRNDPEMQLLFEAAVNAVEELSQEFGRQNWKRFEGEQEGAGDEH